MSKKNFCALPFHHLTIRTNGDFSVCCHHSVPKEDRLNINEHTVDDWLHSDYANSVRKSFVDDQRHPGCHYCWQQEDLGFASMRQRIAKEYEILKVDTDNPSVKNAEINLGNLCNLRCLMCDENESSAILAENQKLKINLINQKDLSWSDDAFANLQELLSTRPKIVNIRGGEPFYNKKLLDLVQKIPNSVARNMVLHITTNATEWNQSWHDALEKFRMVRIMLSIDAVGKLYEYIRFGSSWELVQQNSRKMAGMPNARVLVHCVVQNLNVSDLSPLIEWCDKNSLFLQFDSLRNPHYLQIQNLPEAQKNMAIKNLEKAKQGRWAKHIHVFLDATLEILKTSKFDQERWQEFIENISMRDRLRGNNYSDFIKE